MKKTKYTILLIFLIMALCTACGKVANPMALPDVETITSIEIVMNNTDIIQTDAPWIEAFVVKAKEATPTRQESVQDVPNVPTYTRVDLVHTEGITSLFIYTKSDNWYIEQPYLGIYKTDASILEFLQENT